MMCSKCGNILEKDETCCKYCGQKVDPKLLEEQEKQVEETPYEEINTIEPEPQNRFVYPTMKTFKPKNSIMVAIVVFVGVMLVAYGFIYGIEKLVGGSSGKGVATSLTPSTKELEDGKDKEYVSSKVECGDYEMMVPGYYKTTVDGTTITSTDETNKVMLSYTILDSFSYENVLKDKDAMLENIANLGFTLQEEVTVMIENQEWLVFEGMFNDNLAKYIVIPFNEGTVQVMMYNLGTKLDAEVYGDLSAIISTMKLRVVADEKGSEPNGSVIA